MIVSQIVFPVLEYQRRITSINKHMQDYRTYMYLEEDEEQAQIELQQAEAEKEELGKFLNTVV